jgi:hypothetical protein
VSVGTSARSILVLFCCAALVAAAGCGRRSRATLPTGTGTALPDFATPYREATAECQALTSLSASIKLSGKAGGTKLSARIDSGFAAPAAIRLEGYPRISFGGRPFFILVAGDAGSTLLMPRDARVLKGAAPAAIVEALTGVALGPADLRAIVGGCGLQTAPPSGGRSFGNGWAAVDAGDTSVFLRQIAGQWRVAGALRGALSVTYADFAAGRGATVRVRLVDTRGRTAADLSLRLSQLELNPQLDAKTFDAEVPPDAVPLTLEELRRAGPLGDAKPAPTPPAIEAGS